MGFGVWNLEFINLEFKKMHIELSKDKLYFSIGELADAFGVNASLIRFWDKEFDILKPKKNGRWSALVLSRWQNPKSQTNWIDHFFD